MKQARFLALIVLGALAVGCGGGGSDSGGTTPGEVVTTALTPASNIQYGSALDFEQPDGLRSSNQYVTAGSSLTITGELNSVAVPRGYCPDKTPPSNFSLRWRNDATGSSGSAPIGIGCVTNYLFGYELNGVASAFRVERVSLSLGRNVFLFETFEGGRKIGEDTIVIIREDRDMPDIAYVYPVDGSADVSINHAIIVVFDEAMDEASLISDRLVLRDSRGNEASGTIEYASEHRALMFRPDALFLPNETYEVVLDGAIEDAGGGNALGDDYTWRFTTSSVEDADELVLDSTWPEAGGCDCAHTATRILLKLDEPVDPVSIDSNSLAVFRKGGERLEGSMRYRGDYLEFVPARPLKSNTTYRGVLAVGAADPGAMRLESEISWEFTTGSDVPVGAWSDMRYDEQVPTMAGHTAVVTGSNIVFWQGQGARYHYGQDSWRSMTTVDSPNPRSRHGAVWTGAEMIVWGGGTTTESFNDGGVYDPLNDFWIRLEAPGRIAATYDAATVWTGSEMIVWGGLDKPGEGFTGAPVGRGFRFDPLTEIFVEMSTVGAPAPRSAPAYAWTGRELLIWGGVSADGEYLTDGAKNDPATDSWSAISLVGAPASPRGGVSTLAYAWTGTEFLVWNGGQTAKGNTIDNGFREVTMRLYDPVSNSWRTPDAGWEPFVVTDGSVYGIDSGFYFGWTGTELIVLAQNRRDGVWIFDAATEKWQVASSEGAPFSRSGASAVWVDNQFVVWGGTSSVLPTNRGSRFSR